MPKPARITRPPYVPSEKPRYIDEMDKEIQRFLFDFLPALFDEISQHIDSGFTENQNRQINRYFQQTIALSAIAHPHRLYVIFGQLTHRRIRNLHKYFKAWCDACSNGPVTKNVKEKLRDKMEDALARLSRNYRLASTISLSDEDQRLVLTVQTSINETIRGLPQIGLKSIDQFVEMSTGMPGLTSAMHRHSRASRRSSRKDN